MTRSRRRKLMHEAAKPRPRKIAKTFPAASMMLAGLPVAFAQESTDSSALPEVIVSAEKRDENLQNVPFSITAIDTKKLDELHVKSFDDYVKFLPSVSFVSFGPGFERTFFRGVSSGDNGNHSGPLPSVGMYLDEQPITTIQGPLDIHIYDIARVEALAGPQGTLYGASSEAGTIRIITNKPDPTRFQASYDLQGSVLNGQSGNEGGYVAEGFVNIPLADKSAVRLVGWSKRDPGFISNVRSTRVYPTPGVPINNGALAKGDYNSVDTYGARAALRVELNDRWTITPGVMGQKEKTYGTFAFDPSLGDLKVARFRPEKSDDRWGQASLVIEGKIANLDLTYAGAFLKRDVDSQLDYSDYTFFYDTLFGYGAYWTDNSGTPLTDPSQYIQGKDRYQRHSHELRLSSPSDWKTRFVTGLFFQRQQHGIEQRYKIDGLISDYEVVGWSDTIWLTEQTRVDRDYAIFGELSHDITDKLTATAGLREFKYKNSLAGFFGFGDGYSTSGTSGEALCSTFVGDPIGDRSHWVPFQSVSAAPCENLDRTVSDHGTTYKLNTTYHFDEHRMAYVTYSKGFRPGGVNRRGTFPPYDADYLKNYEIGWKTTWAQNRVRFNGALFWLNWNDFQFSFLGENGLTNIVNAGKARIRGVETDFDWAATDNLLLSGGLSLLNAELNSDFCELLADPDTNVPVTVQQCKVTPKYQTSFAPSGTDLPSVPKYKANLTGRYSFKFGAYDAFFQGSLVFQGKTRADLLPADDAVVHDNDAYGIADISAGFNSGSFDVELFVNNAFDKRADLTRFTQCDEQICSKAYIVTNQPRTIGIRFGQKF